MANRFLSAYQKHRDAAETAYAAYVDHCEGAPPPRVPGMDTVIRLAWSIECGRTVSEAAAAEYLYRWRLAIKTPDQALGSRTRNAAASIFGAPHTIGA